MERGYIMRRFPCVVLDIALLIVVVHLCSCAGGGMRDPGDPIFPSPELKEGVVEPTLRTITVTKDGITVIVDHWSRTRLNRKYTTVDMRSPFFYLETWAQSFQSEVFHVTIKNDTPRNVVVDVRKATMEDERKYVSKPQSVEDLKYRFLTKKYMDLKTRNGFALVHEILLSGVLGRDKSISPGETVAGFLPFVIPSSQATKVWLTLILENAPEVPTAAYKKVEFRFDYIQDLVLRKQQPRVKRY